MIVSKILAIRPSCCVLKDRDQERGIFEMENVFDRFSVWLVWCSQPDREPDEEEELKNSYFMTTITGFFHLRQTIHEQM